jgi:ABC-2 type transport system permease protein
VGGVGAVLAALMSLFTVVRHTRAEEEAGRAELVGSAVVGRHAALTAGLAAAFAADLVLAALVTAGLTGLGEPAVGALALGLSLAAAGWMFAALAAVAAQLAEGARGARGIAAGGVGLAYLLRAVGDSARDGGWSRLSWLSPIGWTQRTRPFAGERWWVFGLAAALVVVLVGAAYALVTRRDLGAGLLPPRLGPAEAAAGLRSPLALAWRLHRAALLGWTAGLAVVGTAVGGVAQGVGDIVTDNPQLADLFTKMGGQQKIVDAYLASTMGVVGLVAAAYAVAAALRLRSEETGLRAEPVLATRVGRTRWALSHLAFAAAGPAVLLAAAGLAAGLTHGLRTGDVGTHLPQLLGDALVQLPAVWVLAGITVALFGLTPRLVAVSWAALVVFLLLGQLGPVLRLNQWAMDVSPFTHVPKLPDAEPAAAPMVWLVAVGVVLTVSGLVGFRRRDVG